MDEKNMSNFITYYFKFKELWELHQKYGFGNAPDLPSGFTEQLCRKLLNLTKNGSNEFDAVDDKNKYEIKATSSKEGKTTINFRSEFDFLIWSYFSLEDNKIYLYKIPYKNFKPKFDELKKTKNGDIKRASITLSEYLKNINPQVYSICKILKLE